MVSKIRVAVVQYDVPMSVESSFVKLDDLTREASRNSVQLLVVPETAIGMLGDVKSVGTDYLSRVQEIAQRNHIAFALSFYRRLNENYVNQGYIVSESGTVLHSTRKVYLAPPERDHDGITPGSEVTVSETPIGRLGMLICKDGFNRFSHFMYERLNQLGCEIMCVPTWSIGWKDFDVIPYVKSLYQYGAFASRAFVLVSGNLNTGTRSFGNSLIISPISGIVREGSPDKEEILIEDIDLNDVKKAREFDSWWQPNVRIV